MAGSLRRSFSMFSPSAAKNVICGRTPLMVESRYPKVLEAWRNIYEEEKVACDESLQQMIRDFGNWPSDRDKPFYKNWFRDVIEYHAEGYFNWSIPPLFFTRLIKGDSITQEELSQARIISNLINMTCLNIFISDDYIDRGATRNGRPCWYRGRDVIAIFDCLRLDIAEIILAHHYLRGKPYYDDILNSILQLDMQMLIGQELDVASETPRRKADEAPSDTFSMEAYKTINYYKSSCFFQRATLTPFYFCGIKDPETIERAREIAILAGELTQVTNDWFDWALWDHSSVNKNVDLATDARKGILTWSIATAWQHANDSQKRDLKKYYGVDDAEAADKVVRLFKEIGVPEKHQEYDVSTCKRLFELFDNWDSRKTGLPGETFSVLLTPVSLYYTEDKKNFYNSK